MAKIIIAATELEMSLLLGELRCRRQEKIMGFDIYVSERNHGYIYVVKSDPGIANAAAATAVSIDRFQPDEVFNIGVCGVYSADKNLLTKVVSGIRAVFTDTGVESDNSFLSLEAIDLPLARTKNGSRVFNIIKLSDRLDSNKLLRCVFSTVGTSTGSSLMASKIKKRFKIDESALLCEDMESAAVGLISLRASVPCSVIRGISNLCGERDYKEWKLTEAAEAAQKALLKYL
jgi:futalosine hydrolase